MILEDAERLELITGIKKGFEDVAHIGKFIDAFIQSVRYRAEHPIIFVKEMLEDMASEIGAIFLSQLFTNETMPKLCKRWDNWASRNKLRGQTISNFAAVCVEIHLCAGKYFTKGAGTNDLRRVKDRSRWEIKGSRERRLKLTINQSHKVIDQTNFVIYCGKPELNKLYGIYTLAGRDAYFTPRKKGLNLRALLKEHYDKADRIYAGE